MQASHEQVSHELPDVAAVLGPLLQRVEPEHQPLLLAMAERMAADRYRAWAESAPEHRDALLACAAREEQIAGSVEALHPKAAAIQADIAAKNPDLEEINRSLFADRPIADQFAIQARGERAGGSTWTAFAEHAEDPVRSAYLHCAELEEHNAAALDAILAG